MKKIIITILGLFIFLGCANHQYQTDNQVNNNLLASTYLSIGNDYLQKGQFQLAFINFNKAIELNPFYSDAYALRGSIYGVAEKYELAIADLNKAIALNPLNSIAYALRGNAYFGLKKYELAIADFNKAIALNPSYYGA